MADYDPTLGCNPCPYCGQPAHIHTTGGGGPDGWGIEHYEGVPDTCPVKHFGFYPPKFATREQAVAAWNEVRTVSVPIWALPGEMDPALFPRSDETCEWKYDPDGFWAGACGATWMLEEGTPHENDMNFCPKCGKLLIEIPPEPEPGDEEAMD